MSQYPLKATTSEWIATYPAEIMICDHEGIILDMSNVAIQIYEKEGSAKLIGRNVIAHHVEPAKSQMMSVVHQKRHIIYTTEEGGTKKLISIATWYREGEYAGFALIVLDLPDKILNISKD